MDKGAVELWDDGAPAQLGEPFRWLFQTHGIGLLTDEPGVGKTATLRQLTATLNPHRYKVTYFAETDPSTALRLGSVRTDLYLCLALASGIEPADRCAQLIHHAFTTALCADKYPAGSFVCVRGQP